jgi:hypothetical protein
MDACRITRSWFFGLWPKRRRVFEILNEGGVNMCKKLIVLLVVAALSTPVMAAYVGLANPLYVDLDGGGVTTLKTGWQGWLFASNWTGPATATFSNPGGGLSQQPIAQLEVYRNNQGANSNAGASRNRDGGMAFVAGTGDFGVTTQGYGVNYLKLTLSQLKPDTLYAIDLWSYEKASVWSMSTANPDSKFVAWGTTNPKSWLDTNYSGVVGEPPSGGYGPKVGVDYPAASTDSNMPAGLAATVLARADIAAFGMLDMAWDMLGENVGRAKTHVMTDGDGIITLYGWLDATDWSGSAHVPLSGFYVMPEPMTITLLGLGALALIRRKRA